MHFTEDVFSPYLMPGKASLIMKYMLQHQRWSDLYTIELKDLRAEDKMVQDTVNKQLNLIDRYVLHRTTDHGSLLACIHDCLIIQCIYNPNHWNGLVCWWNVVSQTFPTWNLLHMIPMICRCAWLYFCKPLLYVENNSVFKRQFVFVLFC